MERKTVARVGGGGQPSEDMLRWCLCRRRGWTEVTMMGWVGRGRGRGSEGRDQVYASVAVGVAAAMLHHRLRGVRRPVCV